MELEYITKKNAPTQEEIMQYMKLPLILFKSENYKEVLSLAAKVLYCFLLDRSNLSLQNSESFTDKSGRAFIFFSWDEAMDALQCGRQKCSKVFKELEHSGLIERVSRGLGKSPKIYVMRFRNEVLEEKTESCEEKDAASEHSAGYDSHTREYENHTRYIESDLPQPDLPVFDPSAMDAKNTERRAASYEENLKQAKKQITSTKTKRFGDKAITELSEVIAWASTTAKETLKVGGISIQINHVREKLWSLTSEQAAEVMGNLINRRIRNRRSYLLTCLYNAAGDFKRKIPASDNAAAYQSFVYNL